MLKIKIFAMPALGTGTVTISGENTVELFTQFRDIIPEMPPYTLFSAVCRNIAARCGVKVEIAKSKNFRNSANLFAALVEAGRAEWLEYREEDFDPVMVVNKMRSARIDTGAKSEEWKREQGEKIRDFYANRITPEQRLAASANRSAAQRKRMNNMTPEEKAVMYAKREATMLRRRLDPNDHVNLGGRPKKNAEN